MSVKVNLNELEVFVASENGDGDLMPIDWSHITISKDEEVVTIIPADGSPAISLPYTSDDLKLELP